MSKEWKTSKKWNPFNSAKLLAHVDTWARIQRGNPVPPPVLVTIDPTNRCNLDCSWCNAKTVRKLGGEITTATLEGIAEFLGDWGVKAVCIAGGGEPLLHDGIGRLMLALIEEQIRVGIVTNGIKLLEDDSYMMADWVGVSVDAGSPGNYEKNKGGAYYYSVVDSMKTISGRTRGTDLPLGKRGLGNGVFWKFLVVPNNIADIYSAAEQAKEIGCKGIHIRPAGTAWHADEKISFSRRDVRKFNEALTAAQNNIDDENFSVYGVQHKFTKDLQSLHSFGACKAVFMTAVIMPAPDKPDGFTLGLCCDRRGDPALTVPNMTAPQEIADFWGSPTHWSMTDAINPQKQCPRCTYAPHNEIFERVIENDDMTHVFI